MRKSIDFSQGRRGPVLSKANKTRITIHIDSDILQYFREQAQAQGKGYQTLINEALKQFQTQTPSVLTEERLRQVIREELAAA
jgi:uncharacterized protein (DUF4415 family)